LGRVVTSAGAEPVVEFAFGAVFTPLLAIPLRAGASGVLSVNDLVPTVSGRFWVADARAAALHIYSHEGHRLGRLDRRATGLRRPVSLTSLHGRWIAALDGHLPAVVIFDEVGRALRRFPLPELDRPVQICNLNDQRLAVVGSGWRAGAGRLLHLYTMAGEYVESLFGEPKRARASDRAYVATAGTAMYLGHSATDSFAVYDLEARAVVSFANLNAAVAERRCASSHGALSGLLAAPCGPLIAQYARSSKGRDYLYDLYSLDGTPVALGLRSPERVISVEGPFFYSLRVNARGEHELRVWKLRLEADGSGEAGPVSTGFA
jgi:hypothetical protein